MKETLSIMHVMDEKVRKMTLDEAFLEALQLAESRASEVEEQEYALFEYLSAHPSFISHISEAYKKEVLQAWEYAIIA